MVKTIKVISLALGIFIVLSFSSPEENKPVFTDAGGKLTFSDLSSVFTVLPNGAKGVGDDKEGMSVGLYLVTDDELTGSRVVNINVNKKKVGSGVTLKDQTYSTTFIVRDDDVNLAVIAEDVNNRWSDWGAVKFTLSELSEQAYASAAKPTDKPLANSPYENKSTVAGGCKLKKSIYRLTVVIPDRKFDKIGNAKIKLSVLIGK